VNDGELHLVNAVKERVFGEGESSLGVVGVLVLVTHENETEAICYIQCRLLLCRPNIRHLAVFAVSTKQPPPHRVCSMSTRRALVFACVCVVVAAALWRSGSLGGEIIYSTELTWSSEEKADAHNASTPLVIALIGNMASGTNWWPFLVCVCVSVCMYVSVCVSVC
jgi:hypothetical protein